MWRKVRVRASEARIGKFNKRRHKIGVIGCSLFLLVMAGAPSIHADEVRLKNGGRVRGEIIIYDPAVGVRIKLGDGEVREIRPVDVDSITYSDEAKPQEPQPASAARAPGPSEKGTKVRNGRLEIRVDEPGRAFLREALPDGRRTRFGRQELLGPVAPDKPLALDVAAGPKVVRVEFDAGGADGARVNVGTRMTSKVELHGLKVRRNGPRFWVGPSGPGFVVELGGSPATPRYLRHDEPCDAGVCDYRLEDLERPRLFAVDVLGIQAALMIPVDDWVGFRFGVSGGTVFVESANLGFHFVGEALVRFIVGTHWAPEVGIGGGVVGRSERGIRSGVDDSGSGERLVNDPLVEDLQPFAGPRFSLANFQFGAHRNVELGIRQGMPILIHPVFGEVSVGLETTLGMSIMAY